MKQRSAGKPDIELGKRIRLRRVEQKISQAELGDKLGVSFQQVQKYEKGINRVGAARLQQIATALDVPVTFFIDDDGKAREVESLLFLDSAFSLRLLRAYSSIKDQTVQRQLVSLMESIAANEQDDSIAIKTFTRATVTNPDEWISDDDGWAAVINAGLSRIPIDRLDTPESHTAYIRKRINLALKS
jgi:transcriptional regulator with XRE-family HTH domain